MNETQLKLTDDEEEFFNELEQQEKAYKANSDIFTHDEEEFFNELEQQEKAYEANSDIFTHDELKQQIISNLEEKKKEYIVLLRSYKTLKPGEDGWYYMGYIEDEYEFLKPYAEKVGMLKEFEDVYNKFWPLEHMTYEDVQKLYNNAKSR